MTESQKIAVVTGASSGIGEATARALALQGYEVVCAARRGDRISRLAAQIGGRAVTCDVTDEASVALLARSVGNRLDVLVNNAGAAYGQSPVADSEPGDWRRMFEVNVLGTLHVTRALLPALLASGDAVIINMGSTAGHEVYERGGGYTVSKRYVATFTSALRQELLGKPVRVTEIAPGMVKTEEFSLVRFGGDREKADAVYAGVNAPLTAEDIARCITWVVESPSHVNVDLLVVRPRAQFSQYEVVRQG